MKKTVSMDYISNLPDEVLGKIMSLLPTKIAASTSVLSKRWRNLLPLVDSFDFDETMLFNIRSDKTKEEESTSFSGFVDKTLALLKNSSPIKKFSLQFDHNGDRSRVNRWIHIALERGCLELNLVHSGVIDYALFKSNKLVKLTISHGVSLGACEGSLFFPVLKTLSLVSVSFDMINFFIHGCPKLEELFICLLLLKSGHKLNKSSLDDSTCIVSDSLVKAGLDIRVYGSDLYTNFWDEICGNVTSLLMKISNVKSLHLSLHSLEMLSFCYSTLVFDNLISLFIECDEEKSWQVLPRLLDNSPNLQSLIMKGLVHRVQYWCGDVWCGDAHGKTLMKNKDEVCCLSRCSVKVLDISGYKGSFRELKHMRHFLGKLNDLETVKVGIEKDTENLRANLVALPRASSKCKIQFI